MRIVFHSDARKRLGKRALNETGITKVNQVAALVEAVAIHATLETAKVAMRTLPRPCVLRRKPYPKALASCTNWFKSWRKAKIAFLFLVLARGVSLRVTERQQS
jgi:hypothetical protein